MTVSETFWLGSVFEYFINALARASSLMSLVKSHSFLGLYMLGLMGRKFLMGQPTITLAGQGNYKYTPRCWRWSCSSCLTVRWSSWLSPPLHITSLGQAAVKDVNKQLSGGAGCLPAYTVRPREKPLLVEELYFMKDFSGS